MNQTKIKHEYDDGPEYLTKGKVYKAIKKAEDLRIIKEDGPEYLTKGKVYKAIKKAEDLLLIKDDKGDFIVVYLPYCAHLDDRPWTIIED